MSAKFHIAMFCSNTAYATRKLFYTDVFGAEPQEGDINDGVEGRQYHGSCWDRKNGILFALLLDTNLIDTEERLAHIGFFFDNSTEFDSAIQKRGINPQSVRARDDGIKQEFKKDKNGVEWEFTYIPSNSDS